MAARYDETGKQACKDVGVVLPLCIEGLKVNVLCDGEVMKVGAYVVFFTGELYSLEVTVTLHVKFLHKGGVKLVCLKLTYRHVPYLVLIDAGHERHQYDLTFIFG